ncbi:unnamed protein product [Acanthoscelides obtectus]|uniref:Uncharacterized protein n=1 Tax=Acanthoscelides obtectus TaxID=200917 RepID=A0A9P0KR69_ACAOB|nr:unnamed protein product [Acanthoscelides obtectus]CAK1647313.1 hypothetical protein AOBTE_LOCUS15174 [Acanthoscelides obtectus]
MGAAIMLLQMYTSTPVTRVNQITVVQYTSIVFHAVCIQTSEKFWKMSWERQLNRIMCFLHLSQIILSFV